MSDQAQGLRALADLSRRDYTDFIPDSGHVARALRDSHNTDSRKSGHDEAAPFVAAVVADTPLAPAPKIRAAAPARIIAVTSGKGGVGKTNFSSNLSLTLARSGQRVIVLDADLGLANLHVVLGITPTFHLEHVLRGEKRLDEILCDGPGGIQILGGGSGITELANLDEATRELFISGVRELDSLADVIVIDTGAGLSRNVLAFLCAVEEIIVVTTPEPTAITDAYATIKVVSRENPSARIMLVVNMAQSDEEAAAAAHRLIRISHQFLGITLDWIGTVPHDPAVTRAIRQQQPFSIAYPACPAARGVTAVAGQLGYRMVSLPPSGGMGGMLTRMQKFFGVRGERG